MQPHVVSATGSIRFKPCLGCGYLVDTWEDFGGTLHPEKVVSQRSLNGSYILSNGIVVLVDEDVDAYFNGLLEFYDTSNVQKYIC